MFALIISFLSVDNFCSAQEPLWNIKKSPFNFCKTLTPWILQLHIHTDAHRLCPSWKKFSIAKFQFVFRISTDGQRNLLFLFSLLSTLEPVKSKITKNLTHYWFKKKSQSTQQQWLPFICHSLTFVTAKKSETVISFTFVQDVKFVTLLTEAFATATVFSHSYQTLAYRKYVS